MIDPFLRAWILKILTYESMYRIMVANHPLPDDVRVDIDRLLKRLQELV